MNKLTDDVNTFSKLTFNPRENRLKDNIEATKQISLSRLVMNPL